MDIQIEFDLREKAIQAYQEKQKNIQEEEAVNLEEISLKTKAAVLEWFGVEPKSVDGYLAVVGDVQLSYTPESWDSSYGRQNAGWRVVGECPKCHEVTQSPWCSSLESIGQYLLNFQTDYGHFCELTLIVTEDETVVGRLASLLREIIGQELAARMEGA